jgi:flagellar motor switch protein FliN/FliY
MSDTDGQGPRPDLTRPMPPTGTDVGYNADE